jgi:hypothetical protein
MLHIYLHNLYMHQVVSRKTDFSCRQVKKIKFGASRSWAPCLVVRRHRQWNSTHICNAVRSGVARTYATH